MSLAVAPNDQKNRYDSISCYDDLDCFASTLQEGQASISKPFLDELSQSPFLLVSVPVFDTLNKVVGALTGVIMLDEPTLFYDKARQNLINDNSFYLISLKHRVFLAATDPKLWLEPIPAVGMNALLDQFIQGYEGYGIVYSASEEGLSAAKRVPVADWLLVTNLSDEEVFQPISEMKHSILIVTLLFSLIAAMVIWWLLRLELKPLVLAVKKLHKITTNRIPIQPLTTDRQDEVGELFKGFNQLMEILLEREQALLAHKEMLARTEGIAHVGSWEWHPATDTVKWSEELFQIFQRNPSQGEPSFAQHSELYPPDDLARLQQAVEKCLADGKPYELELHAIRSDGELRVCLARGHAVVDADNRVTTLFGSLQDITELRQSEDAFKHMHDLMHYVVEHCNSAVAIHDKNLNYIYVSQKYIEDFKLSGQNIIGKHHYEVFPNLPQAWKDAHQKALQGESSRADHDVYLNEDGSFDWTRWDCLPWYEADGSVGGIIIYTQLITEQRKAELELQLAAQVFRTSREGIMITDLDGTIVDVNEAFTSITGYEHDEVVGKNPKILSSGSQTKEFYVVFWRDLIEKGYWRGEIWNRKKSGEVYVEMLAISTVRDPEGHAQHYVALFSDITAIKDHQRQLERIAHYDALTALPNRTLLNDRLQQAMAKARRDDTTIAVAFLDLDGFKEINDDHGHQIGDKVLVEVSKRMRNTLREVDTLARIGGDEFIAVLVNLPNKSSCIASIERILKAVAEPIHIDSCSPEITVSIGLTFFPQDEEIEADQLYRQADQAMYQAKLAGKNGYYIFDAAKDLNVRSHHERIDEIRRALAQREFILYYQPKVNMRSGAIIGAEALIRWNHPSRGLLPPASFLPVIDDHLLSVELGQWVFDTALNQIELWRAEGIELPVSVNVGGRQLQHFDFVDDLKSRLAAHPSIKPGDLEIEILETNALEDIVLVSSVIDTCRELGINFSLDDFGTGYSSLTYLKRLASSVLKIDQSFVRDMLDDPDDLAILTSVIGLAQTFSKQVIAEGVETLAHGEMLIQLGCELAQGYVIAEPMPPEAIPEWIHTWTAPVQWKNKRRLNQDQLPRLYAEVEHRAWVAAIELYIKGKRRVAPALDPRSCHFGLWLASELDKDKIQEKNLALITQLHEEVHNIANKLCLHFEEGNARELEITLEILYRLRDQLVMEMKSLRDSN